MWLTKRQFSAQLETLSMEKLLFGYKKIYRNLSITMLAQFPTSLANTNLVFLKELCFSQC